MGHARVVLRKEFWNWMENEMTMNQWDGYLDLSHSQHQSVQYQCSSYCLLCWHQVWHDFLHLSQGISLDQMLCKEQRSWLTWMKEREYWEIDTLYQIFVSNQELFVSFLKRLGIGVQCCCLMTNCAFLDDWKKSWFPELRLECWCLSLLPRQLTLLWFNWRHIEEPWWSERYEFIWPPLFCFTIMFPCVAMFMEPELESSSLGCFSIIASCAQRRDSISPTVYPSDRESIEMIKAS